jgi:hypothetical protein
MNSELPRHSFIVRIWLEETAEEAGRAVWRGCITHVPGTPDQSPHYIQELDEIPAYIARFLTGAGATVCRRWRFRQALWWLRSWIDRKLGVQGDGRC